MNGIQINKMRNAELRKHCSDCGGGVERRRRLKYPLLFFHGAYFCGFSQSCRDVNNGSIVGALELSFTWTFMHLILRCFCLSRCYTKFHIVCLLVSKTALNNPSPASDFSVIIVVALFLFFKVYCPSSVAQILPTK